MKKLSWKTERRKIKDIVPYAKNPRKPLTAIQEERLKKSLEKFGLVEIPVLDFDNTLIAGDKRLRILIVLGKLEEEIDVRVPNRKLTETELKEYNIISNLDYSEFDPDILKEDFADIDLDDLGLEIDFIEVIEEEEETPEILPVERELKQYRETHILITVSPDKFFEIQDLLEKIRSFDFVNYDEITI